MGVAPLGIHHVTEVASDPQRNAELYLRASACAWSSGL